MAMVTIFVVGHTIEGKSKIYIIYGYSLQIYRFNPIP